MKPDDLCPRPDALQAGLTQPLAPPIYPTVVYRCESPTQADQLLGGSADGYVYSRDGHPNAALLAEKCRQLHHAEQGIVCSSGMAALSLAFLSQLSAGDHVVLSQDLYGKTLQLILQELARLGIESTTVDTTDPLATENACRSQTRLLVVETISNPLLKVADLNSLSQTAHQAGALLLVDNTFAGPTVCRPLDHGADLVMESLSKIINGHSDVMLGFLGGRRDNWERVARVQSAWGFTAGPFDCWLATRGLATLAVRAEKASRNAQQVAAFLQEHLSVKTLYYPGLASHPHHLTARRQFTLVDESASDLSSVGQIQESRFPQRPKPQPEPAQFGCMVSFDLVGGLAGAEAFIARIRQQIPFCPSLADVSTTLSHPASTSHRGLSPAEQHQRGITPGLIRLSVGIESLASLRAALQAGLAAD